MWHPLLALACTALVAARAGADFVTYDALSGHPYSVSFDERAFTINGTRTLLLGGSFHPPRIAYGDWEALLAEAKADGLNHVQIYVFWWVHRLHRFRSFLGMACFRARLLLSSTRSSSFPTDLWRWI